MTELDDRLEEIRFFILGGKPERARSAVDSLQADIKAAEEPCPDCYPHEGHRGPLARACAYCGCGRDSDDSEPGAEGNPRSTYDLLPMIQGEGVAFDPGPVLGVLEEIRDAIRVQAYIAWSAAHSGPGVRLMASFADTRVMALEGFAAASFLPSSDVCALCGESKYGRVIEDCGGEPAFVCFDCQEQDE